MKTKMAWGIMVAVLAGACGGSSDGGGTGTGAVESDAGGGAVDGGGTMTADASAAPQDSGAAQADSGSPGTADASASASTITLNVPAGFKGTTRQLNIVLESALPPAGPPAAILFQADNPMMTAGASMAVTLDTSGQSGDFYVLAVLYMQGGGNFSPKSGVDYEAATMMKVHVDASPHDFGTLDLALAP